MLLGLAGAGMVGISMIGSWMNTPNNYLRRQVGKYFRAVKLEFVSIKRLKRTEYGYRMEVTLPYGLTSDKFSDCLPGLEQAVNAPVRAKLLYGCRMELCFGFRAFYEKMNYTDDLPLDGLKVPLYTPFGLIQLDFEDETNCHLLQGGATRMGKSVFLRLVVTHILRATEGNVQFVFIDHKVTDLYMFQNIPQVEIAETIGEAKMFVGDVLDEVSRRKELLKSKKDVVDLKEFREKYPGEPVPPVFIIIDEYGRFADDKEFQADITEIAETAGYVDVHLLISAQRPDAKDVLNPRIKSNILTRLSFSTSDETNSKIILDIPDAAHLGRIKGRAILLDGFPETVQVPYISTKQAKILLKPFYRSDNCDEPRQENCEPAQTLPSFVKGPVGGDDLP